MSFCSAIFGEPSCLPACSLLVAIQDMGQGKAGWEGKQDQSTRQQAGHFPRDMEDMEGHRSHKKPTIVTLQWVPLCLLDQGAFLFLLELFLLFSPSLFCRSTFPLTLSPLTFQINVWPCFWLISSNSLLEVRRTWNSFIGKPFP